MMKQISILGCGWLGLPLGRQLREQGFHVKGSVTTNNKLTELSKLGIEPYRIILNSEQVIVSNEHFFETDVLIIAIPPKRINLIEVVFEASIRQLIPYLVRFQIPNILFISSTSVYNEDSKLVKEEDVLVPEKPSGRAVLAAENLLKENSHFRTTILRFGGLIGKDRNPARFLLAKKEKISGSKPVNLIHQDDCLAIINTIIKKEIWGEIFNACCPDHPTRKEFYTKASEVSGLPLPAMNDEQTPFKLVDSSKLIKLLGYQFKYKNPIDYLIEKGKI